MESHVDLTNTKPTLPDLELGRGIAGGSPLLCLDCYDNCLKRESICVTCNP